MQLPGIRDYKSIDNEMRALFYLYMQIVKSVDYSTRGTIFIYYAVGNNFREKKNGVDLMKYHTLAMASYTGKILYISRDDRPRKASQKLYRRFRQHHATSRAFISVTMIELRR